MKQTLRPALLVFALLLAAPAWAGDVEDCRNAMSLVETVPARAVAACRRHAEQGDAGAQNSLGILYYRGLGVPQDYAEAVKWHRKAADQGDAFAQSILGFLYGDGQGVPQDYVQAAKWYRLAAEQGQAFAQNNLGLMYRKGQGVAQDYVQAHMWFNLAAARLPALDTKDRDRAVKNRDLVAAKMIPAQIAEAQKLAREWKPK